MKKIIKLFICICFFLTSNIIKADIYIKYGDYITYNTYNKIYNLDSKVTVATKLGKPNIILNNQKNEDIWCYYFIDNARKKNYRPIIRHIIIKFDTTTLKLKSLNFYY